MSNKINLGAHKPAQIFINKYLDAEARRRRRSEGDNEGERVQKNK
jgi:TnpA family transposase